MKGRASTLNKVGFTIRGDQRNLLGLRGRRWITADSIQNKTGGIKDAEDRIQQENYNTVDTSSWPHVPSSSTNQSMGTMDPPALTKAVLKAYKVGHHHPELWRDFTAQARAILPSMTAYDISLLVFFLSRLHFTDKSLLALLPRHVPRLAPSFNCKDLAFFLSGLSRMEKATSGLVSAAWGTSGGLVLEVLNRQRHCECIQHVWTRERVGHGGIKETNV